MAQSVSKSKFPLVKTITSVTWLSVLIVGLVVFCGVGWGYLDGASARGMVWSGVCGLGVCVVSLIFIERIAGEDLSKIAYAQMLGSVIRLVVGVLLISVLVGGFGFEAKAVIVGFVVVYIPVMIVEAVVVANYVKAATALASDQAVTMTEQVS